MENEPQASPQAVPPPVSSPPLVPPPLISRPTAPKRKGGRGWMIVAIVLFCVLGFIMVTGFLGSMAGLAAAGSMGASHVEEIVIQHNGSKNKIVVIDVRGLIFDRQDEWTGVGFVGFIREQFNRAAEDHHVKAVVLRVDSPGGEVLASDEIAREVGDFQKASGKPVVCSMGSLAASGGYYVAAPCRWIVANELTITGSIGVIMQSYNYRGLLNKVGVKPETFKSGKFKDMLGGDKEPSEITPEERAMIQALIDETYTKFTAVVADGRGEAKRLNKGEGSALKDDWKTYADGRVFSGRQAHEQGFVDELGNFDTAVERARSIAAITDADLVQYRPPPNFANIFRLLGKAEVPAIKIDLGVDVPRVHPGKMYFLSTTFFH